MHDSYTKSALKPGMARHDISMQRHCHRKGS